MTLTYETRAKEIAGYLILDHAYCYLADRTQKNQTGKLLLQIKGEVAEAMDTDTWLIAQAIERLTKHPIGHLD